MSNLILYNSYEQTQKSRNSHRRRFGPLPQLSYRQPYRAYTEIDPTIEIICYRSGYKGLLLVIQTVTPEIREKAGLLHRFGGSLIGNSRVKLTNVKDCVKRGLVKEGQDPQKVAADQLVKDGVDVLHTIGGDDTNTAAADLAAFLASNNYGLTVIGLPKTVDNESIQSSNRWVPGQRPNKVRVTFRMSLRKITPTPVC